MLSLSLPRGRPIFIDYQRSGHSQVGDCTNIRVHARGGITIGVRLPVLMRPSGARGKGCRVCGGGVERGGLAVHACLKIDDATLVVSTYHCRKFVVVVVGRLAQHEAARQDSALHLSLSTRENKRTRFELRQNTVGGRGGCHPREAKTYTEKTAAATKHRGRLFNQRAANEGDFGRCRRLRRHSRQPRCSGPNTRRFSKA